MGAWSWRWEAEGEMRAGREGQRGCGGPGEAGRHDNARQTNCESP